MSKKNLTQITPNTIDAQSANTPSSKLSTAKRKTGQRQSRGDFFFRVFQATFGVSGEKGMAFYKATQESTKAYAEAHRIALLTESDHFVQVQLETLQECAALMRMYALRLWPKRSSEYNTFAKTISDVLNNSGLLTVMLENEAENDRWHAVRKIANRKRLLSDTRKALCETALSRQNKQVTVRESFVALLTVIEQAAKVAALDYKKPEGRPRKVRDLELANNLKDHFEKFVGTPTKSTSGLFGQYLKWSFLDTAVNVPDIKYLLSKCIEPRGSLADQRRRRDSVRRIRGPVSVFSPEAVIQQRDKGMRKV